MTDDFFKFPSTPHLTTLADTKIRDDKIMSAARRDRFLQHNILVEEKMDGANLGISFDPECNIRVQNRGAYLHLPASGQWQRLKNWLAPRIDALFHCLSDQYMLFGEWCYARHSTSYHRLPDWFLGFDIYDRRSACFLSAQHRNKCLQQMAIARVPDLATGHFNLHQIKGLLSQSQFSEEPAEGLYLRHDEGDYLAQRAKLVRPDFVQSVAQHWSRAAIEPNHLLATA